MIVTYSVSGIFNNTFNLDTDVLDLRQHWILMGTQGVVYGHAPTAEAMLQAAGVAVPVVLAERAAQERAQGFTVYATEVEALNAWEAHCAAEDAEDEWAEDEPSWDDARQPAYSFESDTEE